MQCAPSFHRIIQHYVSYGGDFEPRASAQSKHLSKTIKIPSPAVISSDIV